MVDIRFGSEADISSPAAGRPARTSAIGQKRTFANAGIKPPREAASA